MCYMEKADDTHKPLATFLDLSGAQLADPRAFMSHMSATANLWCQSSQLELRPLFILGFLAVQPLLELLLVTSVAFTVSCLIQQSTQYWLCTASFIVSL